MTLPRAVFFDVGDTLLDTSAMLDSALYTALVPIDPTRTIEDVRQAVRASGAAMPTRQPPFWEVRYAIFSGVDDLILEATVLGAVGWIAGVGLAFPRENQHLWELMTAGKWDEARAFYKWFYPLLKLDTHVKFVQYIKLAVQEAGLGKEWVREPRLPLAGAEREQVLRRQVKQCKANCRADPDRRRDFDREHAPGDLSEAAAEQPARHQHVERHERRQQQLERHELSADRSG